MRDPKRIDIILEEVKEVWQAQPDWRLCEVLSNVAARDGWGIVDLFYLEDDALLTALKKFKT